MGTARRYPFFAFFSPNIRIHFKNNSQIYTREFIFMTNNNKKYILIDESGDPDFYGNRKKLLVGSPGFQPYLILGMIKTDDRKSLRKAVTSFMENILSDNLYNTIPSVATEKGWYVHARGDHPEIRAKFFEFLRSLAGYRAHIVVAKKELTISL